MYAPSNEGGCEGYMTRDTFVSDFMRFLSGMLPVSCPVKRERGREGISLPIKQCEKYPLHGRVEEHAQSRLRDGNWRIGGIARR